MHLCSESSKKFADFVLGSQKRHTSAQRATIFFHKILKILCFSTWPQTVGGQSVVGAVRPNNYCGVKFFAQQQTEGIQKCSH